jgi:hypothetical protein
VVVAVSGAAVGVVVVEFSAASLDEQAAPKIAAAANSAAN